MGKEKHKIKIGKQVYEYTTKQVFVYGENMLHLTCDAAGIDQVFATEDVKSLIDELEHFITEHQAFLKYSE